MRKGDPLTRRVEDLATFLTLRGIALTDEDRRVLERFAVDLDDGEWIRSVAERAFRAGHDGRMH